MVTFRPSVEPMPTEARDRTDTSEKQSELLQAGSGDVIIG
jgi:hypothetical protein